MRLILLILILHKHQLNKNIENADDELQILHPMPMNVGVELDNYAGKF